MLKNNYHTHVKYCNHATGGVEDYVLEAIKLGFNEIGITDHAPVPTSFMTNKEYIENYCHQNMTDDIVPIYLNDIKEAKEKYASQIKIYSGFETEFIPSKLDYYKKLRDSVEYLNLGIHYFPDENGKIINCYADITYKNLYRYVDIAIQAMETGLFNTLVHPELFMYKYSNINNERKFDDEAIFQSRRICEAAIKNNVYLEVNSNGIKGDLWLYPSKEFWTIAKEYKDLKIIIGADAHSISALSNENVINTIKFCNELGLNISDKMEINH